MSIYLGNTEIGQIYLGTTEISKAYLGSSLVFDGGSTPPTPPTPYDSKVEYITNTGSQYINTGLTLDSGTTSIKLVFDVKFSAMNVGGNSLMVAYSDPNAGVQIFTTSSSILNQGANRPLSTGTRAIITTISTATQRQIKKDNGSYATQNFSRSVSDNSTLYILGFPAWSATSRCAKGTYYSFQVYRNDVLVRDFIPVRVGQVGYLYDQENGQLYANAGSGSFTIGNDITT